MAEPVFETYLLEGARKVLDGLPPESAAEVRDIIDRIERDPWADGEVKIVHYQAPVTYTVYLHPKYRLLYTIRGNARIAIEAIRVQ